MASEDLESPTTIQVSRGTKDDLTRLKIIPEEKYDSVIKRLIKEFDKKKE